MFGFFELFSSLLAGFYAVIPSLGLAIILLTIVVRLVLLPLSIKQTRSMREMQMIQPEIKRIQAKNKGNRQKMNEEMMALYKEHGVNPLGGCLPLLMQFPVLIGLFYVVRAPLKYLGYTLPEGTDSNAVVPPMDYVPHPDISGFMETLLNSKLADDLIHHALRVNEFIGLRLDCSSSAALSNRDPSAVGQVCGNSIIDAFPYLLLVGVMGFTTWYQQKQMQAGRGPASDQMAQQMQLMGKIMPIFLMVLAYTFPTGVVLYWVTTNLWTMGQQKLMLRAVPPLGPGGSADGKGVAKPAAKPPPGGKPARGAPGKPAPAKSEGDATPSAPKPHPSSKKKKRR
jgi:YidC/Oxa1 family membrane protein insertase